MLLLERICVNRRSSNKPYECGNESLGPIKCVKFLNQLGDCQVFMDSTSRNFLNINFGTGFELLRVVVMESSVFWHVMKYSPLKIN
jgi:hypothetical protein